MDDEHEINLNAVFFLCIGILICIFLFLNMTGTFNPKPIEKVKDINTTIQYVYINTVVTPEVDGKFYFASEYDEGIRKINNPFSFYRTNVSGYKSLQVSSMVYDYVITETAHWFNPSDYKSYGFPPSEGKKYLWVFYAIWQNEGTGEDTRLWLPNTSTFIVANMLTGKAYSPVEYPQQLRINELEYKRDFSGTVQAQYFGQHRQYVSDLNYKDTAGEISEKHTRLMGGKSNAESGYVLYEIDKNDNAEDLIAGINFYSWGNAWWKLKP